MQNPGPHRTAALLLTLCALTAYCETVPWHDNYSKVPDAPPPTRTIKQIEGFIADKGIRSVENFLSALHKVDPAMFKDSVLVFWTKSLQEASYQYPRVLLRSEGAKYIPFDDLAKLPSVLDKDLAEDIKGRLKNGDAQRRMPKDLPPLSEEEIQLILKYLQSRL